MEGGICIFVLFAGDESSYNDNPAPFYSVPGY